MIELTMYLPILWFMVKQYGVQGAAIAWTFRALLDATFLLCGAQHFLKRPIVTRLAAATISALVLFWTATLTTTISQRLIFLGAASRPCSPYP